MDKKVVVIYQKQYEDLLKSTVSEKVNVVLWLPAELVQEDVVQFEQQLRQVYDADSGLMVSLMISWHPYKDQVWKIIRKLDISSIQVMDAYKAYMANFPIKRYQRIMNRRSGEVLDGLILGISHGMTGIVEEMMPGNVCNLCESSQDIYFNYRVLEGICEEYPESIKELKYVVFDMFDYTYFNFDTILTGTYAPFLEESGFWCEERCNWNKQYSVEQINEWLREVWQEGETDEQQEWLYEIFPEICEKDESVYKSTTVLKSRKHTLTDSEIDTYKKNFEPSSLQANVFENTVEFQISNFEKIVKLLQNINPKIRVFLVLLPKYYVAEQYDKDANYRWNLFFKGVIEGFREEYPFLELLDMKNCEIFSRKKSFYEDISHFNYCGACRFTEYLARLLCKGYGLAMADDAESSWEETAAMQLLNALDANCVNEETISTFYYWHLSALLDFARKIPDGKDQYIQIKSDLEALNVKRLKKQKKIVVGFIANYASTWIGDELYRLFEVNEKFEPYVFLISNHNGQSEEMLREEYEQNFTFFKNKDLRVVRTLDAVTGEQYTWEEIGIRPELCIWLTSWIDLFRGPFYMLNYSLDTLHTYIPYGIMIAENEKNNFVYQQYDKKIHNLGWKNFAESQISMDMSEKYAFVGNSNVIYTGYPKMDVFYRKRRDGFNVWEHLLKKAGNPQAKKVIFAPHHTLDETEPVHFSTFATNYLAILELVKKYEDQIIFVFKPHPQLKYKAIKAGLFKNIEEWNEYENKWKEMKNAQVMEEGAYDILFFESDAMILDSVSFLAEYLYAHKPLLFLQGQGQRFNDFGSELMKIHYCADGQDVVAIENFLEDIVLKGNDIMLTKRETFFHNNLDYEKIRGKNAAANIYDWICSELCEVTYEN